MGPFELLREGVPVTLSARKPRTLLAMLVLDAGRVVPSDRMVRELWDDEPPASAVSNLRTYVSRLRQEVFAGDGSRLVSDAGGWRLVLNDPVSARQEFRDFVDVAEFERWAAVGERARTDDEALRAYDQALRLWRGQPFTGVDGGPVMSAAAAALEERYAAIVEESFDIRLGADRPACISTAEVVADLHRHIATYPLRERPRQQLMLALYRSGDPAAALRAYADARAYFRDVLGLDPGVELRRLQQAVLRRDPILEASGRTRDDRAAAGPPLQVAVFGARIDEALAALLAASGVIVLCRGERIASVVRANGGVAVRLADAAAAVGAADAVLGLDDSWEAVAAVGLAKQRPDVRVVALGATGWDDIAHAVDPAEAIRLVLER